MYIDISDTWQFIWGIKSSDDVLDAHQANLYTLNDFDICYNKQTNKYIMNIETIYKFDEGIKGEHKYMLNILQKFTQWMKNNNYKTNYAIRIYDVFTEGKNAQSEYDSIEELYAYFKLFVTGLCEEDKV